MAQDREEVGEADGRAHTGHQDPQGGHARVEKGNIVKQSLQILERKTKGIAPCQTLPVSPTARLSLKQYNTALLLQTAVQRESQKERERGR